MGTFQKKGSSFLLSTKTYELRIAITKSAKRGDLAKPSLFGRGLLSCGRMCAVQSAEESVVI